MNPDAPVTVSVPPLAWRWLLSSVDPAKAENYLVTEATAAIEAALTAGLTPEHATFLSSVLRPDEAAIARRIMIASSQLPATVKLGHAGSHSPKLALGDYLEAEAQPPARVHRGLFWGYTDILGNDTLGDCGEAMTLHAIEGIHHAAGTPVPRFEVADSVSLYSAVGGYVPGDPNTDNGTDNAVLVKYWQSPGVRCAVDNSLHRIVASLFVDPKDEVQNKIAIYEFAVLFRALGLPITAQNQTRWSVVGDGSTGDSALGSWGYHDVPYMAYDPSDYDADTWGVWMPVDQAFDTAYSVQGFVVLTPEMLSRTGISPTGLNYTKLMADYQKLIAGGDAS